MIRGIIRKSKIKKLLDILDNKGTFKKNYDGIVRQNEEKTMLEGVNILYHNGLDTEEELTEVIEGIYNYLHAPYKFRKH